MDSAVEFLMSYEKLSDDQIGKAANVLADRYRKSGNIRDLHNFLDHSDPRVVALGAWIIAECGNLSGSDYLKEQLCRLLDRPDSGVRLEAARALAQFAANDSSVVCRIMELLSDENDGVRHIATLHLCLFPDEYFKTHDHDEYRVIVKEFATKARIMELASSDHNVERSLAYVSALRNFGDDNEFLATVLDLLPDFIKRHVAVLPRNRRFQ